VLGHQALAESGLLNALGDAALAVEQQSQQQEPIGLAQGGEDRGCTLSGIRASAPDDLLRTHDHAHSLPAIETRATAPKRGFCVINDLGWQRPPRRSRPNRADGEKTSVSPPRHNASLEGVHRMTRGIPDAKREFTRYRHETDMKAIPMTSFRRPSLRLVLATGAAALVLPAAPVLANDWRGTTSRASVPVVGEVIVCERAKCDGTQEKDTIVGDQSTQRVVALGGDDDIELDANFSSGSGDVAFGGEGRDCIDGGAGNDMMFGGPGDDNRPCEFTAFVDPQAALTGGPGDDTIYGGAGNDSMNGIFDDDTLYGGTGDDFLRDTSPRDEDRLFGEEGNDTLDARDGDNWDLIDGGPGNDNCSGDAGDRFVNCESITRL
jgi:hypothetical protein